MNTIPRTENALVVRADFNDQHAWERIRKTLTQPVGLFRFRAALDFLDNIEYDGLAASQVLGLLPPDYPHSFILLADRLTMTNADHPLLVIDLFEEPGRVFRAVPKQIQGIENNLSIATMDFQEFADAVDADGIFRGFRRW